MLISYVLLVRSGETPIWVYHAYLSCFGTWDFQYDEARSYIEKARKSLATEVAAVVSYSGALMLF